MEIKSFEEAIDLTKKFTSKPANDELLKLYGLYKQATEGDNIEDRPAGFDFVAAAKHNSWLNFAGLSKEDAQNSYIEYVKTLAEKYI